ncbi:MAG TPA: hypothetical protein VJ111_03455 [Chitinophagaceae bacterium]|nr:hypothetical protein [Chitinophagaceae bacterium]
MYKALYLSPMIPSFKIKLKNSLISNSYFNSDQGGVAASIIRSIITTVIAASGNLGSMCQELLGKQLPFS